MGLFKSFFPGLAGSLDASLGDQYAPHVSAYWPLSDPEQVERDKAGMTRASGRGASRANARISGTSPTFTSDTLRRSE